jgi:hypothetical protein
MTLENFASAPAAAEGFISNYVLGVSFVPYHLFGSFLEFSIVNEIDRIVS